MVARILLACLLSSLACLGQTPQTDPGVDPAYLANFLSSSQIKPTDITGLQVWLRTDASPNTLCQQAANTPPVNSGDTIWNWTNSVSGTLTVASGNAFQNYAAFFNPLYRPTNGPIGKPCIQGALNAHAYLKGTFITPLTNYTLGIIFKGKSSSTGSRSLFDTNDAGYRSILDLGQNLGAPFNGPFFGESISAPFVAWKSWDYTNSWQYITVGATSNGVANTALCYVRTNGVLAGVGSGDNSPSAPPQLRSPMILHNDLNSIGSDFFCYEVVIYSYMNTNDLQTLEAYLARRVAGTQ